VERRELHVGVRERRQPRGVLAGEGGDEAGDDPPGIGVRRRFPDVVISAHVTGVRKNFWTRKSKK
jgi:hypothetical protein